MPGGEHRRGLEVGRDLRAEQLRQSHPLIPAFLRATGSAHQDHRPLGGNEQVRGAFDRLRGCVRCLGRRKPLDPGQLDFGLEGELLQPDVETDIHRTLGWCPHERGGSQHALHQRPRRARLVVPLDTVAKQRALVFRCMDPLDPGAALACVGRSACAHDEYRQSIAPGVEDPQQAVHQADVGVQHDRHRPIRRLGIAVRDGQRVIFVQAQQQLRVAVAEVVDQAVVKSAKAGARIERDVFDSESAQHLGCDIAAPCHRCIAARRGPIDSIDVGHLASVTRTQFLGRVPNPLPLAQGQAGSRAADTTSSQRSQTTSMSSCHGIPQMTHCLEK